ncbi:unnamed protein product [Anisakis simplex]|uniref:Uncharacterized protein n=1 Tax=Anisakis simplex TaxID=6269 RepID=A0A0M3J489_ANISI|nr:unnamed protein product [Anisakis simplex]
MLLNALISTGIILNLISEIDCGCYQKRLCCPGRNLTCVGFEDGIEHLPIYRTHLQNPAQSPTSTSSTSTSTSTSTTDPPTVHFVYDSLNVETRYPDTLIEQPEGSGNDYYAKYGEQIPIDEMPFEPTEFTIPFQRYGTTLAPSFKKIVFGEPFFASEHPPEIMRYRGRHLLLRFAVCCANNHLQMIETLVFDAHSLDTSIWN